MTPADSATNATVMSNSSTKIYELQFATTNFVNKLTALTLALHSSADNLSHHHGEKTATKDEQLQQQLLDLLKHWTDQLNNIGTPSISSPTALTTPASSSATQTIDQSPKLEPVMADHGVQSLPKIPVQTVQPTPPAFIVPTVLGNGMLGMTIPTTAQLNLPKNPAVPNAVISTPGCTLPRNKHSTLLSRRPITTAYASPAALTGFGTCGIGVVSSARSTTNAKALLLHQPHHHHQQQQRRGGDQRQMSSLRRVGPSNAYLSAGSKLYQQQQQPQQQTPGMPPSFAYLSAGSKLVQQTLQQQQQLQRLVKRQQQKLAPLPVAVCCSSTTASDTDTVVAATVAAISSIFSGANTAAASVPCAALTTPTTTTPTTTGTVDDNNTTNSSGEEQQQPMMMEMDNGAEEEQQQRQSNTSS